MNQIFIDPTDDVLVGNSEGVHTASFTL